MTENKLLGKLENVQENGGGWTARCPAHEDQRNSLSVSIGDDDRLLIHCHAGCNTADIVKAVGLRLIDLFPPKPAVTITGMKPRGKVVAEYNYHDADGNLVYQAVRLDPKDFRQRRPDGDGDWIWNMKGVEKIPYRLAELLAADPGETVFIAEGEKDSDRLVELKLIATTNVGGAGKWLKSYSKYFKDRSVVILPDNDDPGRDHAESVAEALQDVAKSIKIIQLDVPAKGDVSDWIAGGGTAEKLIQRVGATEEWKPDPDRKVDQEKRERKPSQASVLVGIADNDVEFFHTADGDAYATIAVGEHHEHYPIRSKVFRRWLARQYYLAQGGIPSAQAMQDVIGVLEGKALFDGDQHDVHVRVAQRDGKVYLDLCDPIWRAVEIDAAGWRMVDQPPVKFRRAKAMLALPEPVDGTVGGLRRFVNVTDEQWPLVVAFIVGALRPTGPYPILGLHGEQGSAKTTATRLIRSVIDPNSAPVRAEPREPRDLMITANNGWLVALDNLSYLKGWLSDALCRLSTGGGFSCRTLYENSEETIFDATRPVILTGIEEVGTRSDLIDRSLLVSLPTIPEDRRRSEADLWREFDQTRPGILGGVLTAVAAAIKNLPTTSVVKLPRMADFALWVIAAEPALNIPAGTFLDAYTGNRDDANALALEASPVAKLIMEIVTPWIGTASELLKDLEAAATDGDKRLKSWPKTPRSLSGAIKRLAPTFGR